MESELFDRGVGVEGGGGRTVEEGDEDAGLLGEEPDGLDGSEADEIEELIDGRVCARSGVSSWTQSSGGERRQTRGKVSDVDRSTSLIVGSGGCSEREARGQFQ